MTDNKGDFWPEPEVECTYDFCNEKFCTDKDMKRHKTQADLHFYCKKCDLDFESDKIFIMHRVITKKKHITCPDCGQDFRSRAGLDDHVELMHPRRQDIKCLVCNKRVGKAALLLKHVEDGHCKITPAQFRQERAERAVAKEIFLERSSQESTSQVPQSTFNHAWPPQQETHEQAGQKQAVQSNSAPLSVDDLAHQLAEADIDAAPLPQDDQVASTPLSQAQTQYGGSQASSAPAQQPTTFKMSNYWCTERQAFVCPGKNCGQPFKTTGDFHDHLTGPAHAGGQFECPSCLKIFSSRYALLSHMESPSRKCQIRYSTHYTQVLRNLTAGLLGTGGHFSDGTVKYIMPDDEGWQRA